MDSISIKLINWKAEAASDSGFYASNNQNVIFLQTYKKDTLH